MRLAIWSDAHLEWYKDGGKEVIEYLTTTKPDGVDALLLAGDLTSLGAATRKSTSGGVPWEVVYHQFARICDQYPRVFYVPGNHDFYGTDPQTGMEFLREMASKMPNLVVLEPGRVEHFMEHRFLGGTLWFPYTKGSGIYHSQLSDFSAIGQPFPGWAYDHYNSMVGFLNRELYDPESSFSNSRTIVVTHHLPSYRSVHPNYATSPLNRFFVGNIEEILVEKQPALVVHGHTHNSADYMIGSTRVICNPLGYPGEENIRFNPSLVVEPTETCKQS